MTNAACTLIGVGLWMGLIGAVAAFVIKARYDE